MPFATRIVRRSAGATEAEARALLGVEKLDSALGGGLMRGRQHELFAATSADMSTAAGFSAMLALLASPAAAPVFWLREEKAERQAPLHVPGLAEIGIDPQRLFLAVLPDALAVLRAAVDVVRCAGVGAAIVELWRNPRVLDLTASRRLSLAAQASGVTTLLLRSEAKPGPSAAQTRWSVQAAPSAALEAGAPGYPSFAVELLRQRGRPEGGRWHLEWNRDRSIFHEAALSGAVVSLPSGRPLEEAEQRRAG